MLSRFAGSVALGMKHFLIIAALVFVPVSLHARDTDSWEYESREIGKTQKVTFGKVVAMRSVQIKHEARKGVSGALIGAVIGGIIGGALDDSDLARGAGAVVGGAVGNNIERASKANRGVEMIITLDNGRVVSIVQSDAQGISPGSRVAVTSGRKARVFRVD